MICELKDFKAAAELFREICSEEDIFYKPLSDEKFRAKFCGENRVCLGACEGETLAGVAFGTRVPEKSVSYISFIGVKKEFRRRGVGRSLLSCLESELYFDGIEKIDIVFHNPVGLEWYIPAGNGDDHPYAPGVDMSTAAYPFFKAAGYTDFAIQNSYYQRLSGYKEPPAQSEVRKKLLEEGIEITLYDSEKHRGLYELFDGIKNPGWRNTVMADLSLPIVVAVDRNADNLVIAYTGPLSVQKSGRGGFCGIGTLPAYRGRGIGKLVFCEMCRRHAEGGASFMSLYTGDTNNARRIYEAAGFRIVHSWADMRKKLAEI